MSGRRRVALGVATLWPFLYIVFFIVVIGIATVRGGGEPDNELIIPEALLFALHIFTMLVVVLLMVVYLVHAYRSEELVGDKKTFWVIALFMGNLLAMPVYWWMFLRPGRKKPETRAGDANRGAEAV